MCVTGFGKTDLMGIIVDSSYETLDQLGFQIITLRKNTIFCLPPGAEVMPIRLHTCQGEAFPFGPLIPPLILHVAEKCSY